MENKPKTGRKANPESQNVEYKESWHDDYLKWICGFANAKGGTLWIGIDDAGNAVGVRNAKKLMEDIPNKIRDVLGIVPDVSLAKRGGKDVLKISVPVSDFPIAYRGEYHYRAGTTKQQLTGMALNAFLLRKMGVEWDESPMFGDRARKDFSFTFLTATFLRETGDRFRETDFASCGLETADGRLTNAGALMADDSPLPQNKVVCTRWNGLDMTDQDMEARGSGIRKILDAYRKAKANPGGRVPQFFSDGGQFRTLLPNLLYGFAPPKVAPPKVAPPQVAPPQVAPPQVAPPKVAPPKKVKMRLAARQPDAEARGLMRLLLALRDQDDGVSSAELLSALSLKSHKDLHVRFLLPAMSRQWIEYTVPEKPRSRLQRYRLTPEGRAEIMSRRHSGK